MSQNPDEVIPRHARGRRPRVEWTFVQAFGPASNLFIPSPNFIRRQLATAERKNPLLQLLHRGIRTGKRVVNHSSLLVSWQSSHF